MRGKKRWKERERERRAEDHHLMSSLFKASIVSQGFFQSSLPHKLVCHLRPLPQPSLLVVTRVGESEEERGERKGVRE